MLVVKKAELIFLIGLSCFVTGIGFCEPKTESIPLKEFNPQCRSMIITFYEMLLNNETPSERMKFSLALELNDEEYQFKDSVPDSIENPFSWIGSYWVGMQCELANIMGDTTPELFVSLMWLGTSRQVSIYVFEVNNSDASGYELLAFERGLVNLGFILGGGVEYEKQMAAILSPLERVEYLSDLDGDGSMEIILHSVTEGFEKFALSGLLYWPYILKGQDDKLIDASELFPEYYSENLLPLYKPLLDALQQDWKEQGGEGLHPLFEKIDRIEVLLGENNKKL